MLFGHCLAACLILWLAGLEDNYAQSPEPTIGSESKTMSATVGSSVVLECKVSNLGSRKVTWTDRSKGTTIYKGGQLMTNNPTKYSIISPSDSSAYNLMILLVQKSDQGFYECRIDGTDTFINIHLDVREKPNEPEMTNLQPLNRTECCRELNVSETCLPACAPSSINLASFEALSQCEKEGHAGLVKIVECLTAGSNHEHCCQFNGVLPACLSFCRNDVPSDLGSRHDECLKLEPLSMMIKCAVEGFATLPSEPEKVSVIPHYNGESAAIMVTWQPPARNAEKVTGYKIMYKRSSADTYFSVSVKSPLTRFYRLDSSNIVPNSGYDVYLTAMADFGASGESVEVSVYIPGPSVSIKQNENIDTCCKQRQVSDKCRQNLCQSKTWSGLNVDFLSECYPKLDDIFTCLVGQGEHTNCCNAFGVSAECLPLCSGQAPKFDISLVVCVQQMAIIEACVQQGFESSPLPPQGLVLQDVKSHSAVLTFTPSPSFGVVRYVVLLKEGEEPDSSFTQRDFLPPSGRSLILYNLTADTSYAVRLASETQQAGSLPSETVHFLTYPGNFGEPTIQPVINVPHNLSECCYSKDMPDVCAKGCRYVQDISSYFQGVIVTCYSYIGSVLSCAADGRDHKDCCIDNGVTDPDCIELCGIAKDGPLDEKYIKCLADTPKAIKCFQSGITQLPRYPDVFVSNVSQNTISLQWKHPETSTLIDKYIVQYKSSSQSVFNEVNTTATHFILQNLLPATEYEITLRSQNENGTSSPSPLITQYTLEGHSKKPDFGKSEVSGREYWSNITECCHNSGISDRCIDQCINKNSGSMDANCVLESHKMLACYLDGEDHGECCKENPYLPDTCVSICRGNAMNLSLDVTVCMGHRYRDIILSCYLANTDLIPTVPRDMYVTLGSQSMVTLSWNKPLGYCGTDCEIDLHYWREDRQDPGARNVIVKTGVTSPYSMNLETEGFYTFTLTARNTYGSSRPSSRESLYVSTFVKDVKVTLVGNNNYIKQGETAVLRCAAIDFNPADRYTIKWLFGGRRQLDSTSSVLVLNDVGEVDEGTYSCLVKDSVIEVTDSLFLSVQYAPKFVRSSADTNPPSQGEMAKVTCMFLGLPDTAASVTQWMKNHKKLKVDADKYYASRQVNAMIGVTEYTLSIANVFLTDYADYSLFVSNTFGKSSCVVTLKNPDDLLDIVPKKKETDPEACCQKKGVSELCQELCAFDIDVAAVVKDYKFITCLSYFTTLISCGADGRDHRKCCKDNGVTPYCFPFCAGQSPSSHVTEQDSLLDCIADSQQIFKCMEDGQNFAPFPPTKVMVQWWGQNKKIQIRWSRPEFNHNLVQSYVVYYKEQGQLNHAGRNKDTNEYIIQNPVFTAKYEVYVIAKGANGLQSQKSNVATLEPLALSPPTDVKTEVSGTTVVMKWTAPADADSSVQYIINYKEENAVRYTKTRNIQGTSFTLSSLEADTQYSAYVTSINGASFQSGPSHSIKFTTGQAATTTAGPDGTKSRQGGSDDDHDKIAIALGVVVGIIALVIIGVVIFVIIRGRGGFKSSRETVAFENPMGGAPGGVKIHGMGGSSTSDDQFNYGRLEKDGAYDNMSGPAMASAGGAYDNPTYAGQESNEVSSGGAATNEGAATLEVKM